MTEYQKHKIPELRSSGMGYKAIANFLGLTRDVVRGFCKKYGLEGKGMAMKQRILHKLLTRYRGVFSIRIMYYKSIYNKHKYTVNLRSMPNNNYSIHAKIAYCFAN